MGQMTMQQAHVSDRGSDMVACRMTPFLRLFYLTQVKRKPIFHFFEFSEFLVGTGSGDSSRLQIDNRP